MNHEQIDVEIEADEVLHDMRFLEIQKQLVKSVVNVGLDAADGGFGNKRADPQVKFDAEIALNMKCQYQLGKNPDAKKDCHLGTAQQMAENSREEPKT